MSENSYIIMRSRHTVTTVNKLIEQGKNAESVRKSQEYTAK